MQDRRQLLQLALAALPASAMLSVGTPASAAGSVRDFDWFVGTWRVEHRRLRQRFAGSQDWETFHGTTTCQALLGGAVNLNESQGRRESGAFRGMGLRAYDAKTDHWCDWYLSASDPTNLGAPGIGRFEGKVGTFLSEEEIGGIATQVRGRFTSISPGEATWEQAMSPDGGASWETNWVMRYLRAA
jgi:hypothetical protein